MSSERYPVDGEFKHIFIESIWWIWTKYHAFEIQKICRRTNLALAQLRKIIFFEEGHFWQWRNRQIKKKKARISIEFIIKLKSQKIGICSSSMRHWYALWTPWTLLIILSAGGTDVDHYVPPFYFWFHRDDGPPAGLVDHYVLALIPELCEEVTRFHDHIDCKATYR